MMKLLSSSVHCFSSQASLYSENNLISSVYQLWVTASGQEDNCQ